MGSKVSTLLQPEEVAAIHLETGFTANQIYRLYSRFTRLDKAANGYLCQEDFFRIPELAINPLSERIVYTFFSDDGIENDQVNFRQFIRVLARFLPYKKHKHNDKTATTIANNNTTTNTINTTTPTTPATNTTSNCNGSDLNSREEKLKFAFKMYDLDGDKIISRDELINVLHMMVGANISSEQLGSIADRTLLEADCDQDGCISFQEFCTIMSKVDVNQKMSIRFLN